MPLLRFLRKVLHWIWVGLNTIRLALLNLIALVILVLILASFLGRESMQIPAKGALLVDPEGMLVEQLQGSPLDRALAELDGDQVQETLVRDVTDSIDQAAGDKRITTIVLALDGLEGGGLAKLQDIGRSLDKARAAGKQIIAVGDGYTRDQYYLASRADEIIMHPLGAVYLEGYEYFRTFFAGALDKLSVDLNVFRVGEFKSFVEPFIRNDMSPEDKEASRRWVGALWSGFERDVANARDVPVESLDGYANRYVGQLEATEGDAARAAVDAGLVDKLMSRPDAEQYLIDVVGESETEDGTYSAIDFRAYMRAVRLEEKLLGARDRNVGVVVASGDIVDGDAPPGTVGGDTLAAALHEAALDDSVEAVVLRVDSPGGSVFASEVIYDEIEFLKASGKPVVASMSTVAASGGYFISMAADEIWASESTITGSIGVGALFPTVQRGLARLGVHVDGFGTTELAGQLRADRELGPQAREMMTLSVQDAYRMFVTKVAASRKVSFEEADKLARGRVWIGSDAKELGLVDQLGDLNGAIQAAAARVGLEEGQYGIRYVEPEMSLGERLAVGLAARVVVLERALGLRPSIAGGQSVLERTLAAFTKRFDELAALNDPKGLYYHCDCGVR